MLPSGLFWTSDQCSKFGGYVCKKWNQDNFNTNIENQTISGVQGYISSPSKCQIYLRRSKFENNSSKLTISDYPNLYPANTDYWIKLIGPENTRLVIKFTKIDLEEQNDCLYDYISIEDDESYENVLESGLTKSMTIFTPEHGNSNLVDDYAMDEDIGYNRIKKRRKKRYADNSTKKSSLFKHVAIEPSFLPYGMSISFYFFRFKNSIFNSIET